MNNMDRGIEDNIVASSDQQEAGQELTDTDESRREALRKIAKYAAYTPPVTLAMFASAEAQSLPSNPPDPPFP